MSKKIAALIIGILVCIYGTPPVLAANSSSGGQSSGTSQQTQQQTAVSNQGTTQQVQSQTQVQVQTQTMTGSPTGMQVQNQVETQNQGEDQLLKVSTQEQESLNSQGGSMSGQSVIKSVNSATKNAEDILNTSMVKGGPGEKIQDIVKSQALAQTQITTEVQKLDSRKGIAKSFIGPDYKAIKTLTQQMEQNQLRITELEQLKNQLVSQGDITMVQETIQAFVDQNTALQEKIASEEKTGSVFGWFFKFFSF
jgi:hypothetical protein